MTTKHPYQTHHRGERGVTLVELMVAVVVALLLLAGLIQVYLSNKQSYNAQEQLARMQESGRFAMDLITRDLRRAGYWGGNVDTSSVTGVPGRSISPQASCVDPTAWATSISWRVAGVDNNNTDYEDCTPPDYEAGTDILTVRYAEPQPLATLPTDGTLLLRSTLFAGRIMRGNNQIDSANQLPPLDPATPDHLLPQVRRLVAHAYFIADSATDICNGQPVPALHRVALLPGGVLGVEELAPGIEQLQVQYLVGNSYVDASAGLNWPEVSAVRVWLLARSNCPESGLDNPPTFDMGNTLDWPSTTDNFRRQLYITTTMLRNTLVR